MKQKRDVTPQRSDYSVYLLAVVLALLVSGALYSVIGWAQKEEKSITLEDLGVTPEQKAALEKLWDLKRQKGIQAIADLKTLNRLAKDTLVADTDIQASLDKFRRERHRAQAEITELEESLVTQLPTRAQLHLTLMGVLDNGVPRRFKRAEPEKQGTETADPPSGGEKQN